MERRTYAPRYCATCRAETPHYTLDAQPGQAPRCKECEIRPREADDPVVTGERPTNGVAEQNERAAITALGPQGLQGIAGTPDEPTAKPSPEGKPQVLQGPRGVTGPISEFLDGVRNKPFPPEPQRRFREPPPAMSSEEIAARALEQEALQLERRRVEVLKLGLDGVFQVGAALIQGRVRDQEVHDHLASLARGFLREALDLDHD